MWGKRGCDFAPNSGGEFAAAAIGRYTDLEGSVSVRREEGEAAEIWCICYVHWYSILAAELENVCAFQLLVLDLDFCRVAYFEDLEVRM